MRVDYHKKIYFEDNWKRLTDSITCFKLHRNKTPIKPDIISVLDAIVKTLP